jgi:hypothetical protein
LLCANSKGASTPCTSVSAASRWRLQLMGGCEADKMHKQAADPVPNSRKPIQKHEQSPRFQSMLSCSKSSTPTSKPQPNQTYAMNHATTPSCLSFCRCCRTRGKKGLPREASSPPSCKVWSKATQRRYRYDTQNHNAGPCARSADADHLRSCC